MKKLTIGAIGILFLLVPLEMAYALSSEVHITKNGAASISTAKVIQVAGSTFFSRLYWGDSFVRITIKTGKNTKFLRATGEATTIAEINEGDLLDAAGELQSGSDTLTLVASTVTNSSVQKERTILSGKVTAIDLSARQFTIESKQHGAATIKVIADTQFILGSRIVDIGHLRTGDLITKVSGDYDYKTKTLSVTQAPIIIYINPSLFKPRVFVGKVETVTLAASSTPASLGVTIGGTLHTINFTDKTTTSNKTKQPITLNRFVAGDSVRLYGTLRESDSPTIDAEVIRNMSL